MHQENIEENEEEREFGIKEIKPYIKPPRQHPMKPYSEYYHHPAWRAINQAIQEMVDRNLFTENTVRKYIIGPIIKQLLENDFLK